MEFVPRNFKRAKKETNFFSPVTFGRLGHRFRRCDGKALSPALSVGARDRGVGGGITGVFMSGEVKYEEKKERL